MTLFANFLAERSDGLLIEFRRIPYVLHYNLPLVAYCIQSITSLYLVFLNWKVGRISDLWLNWKHRIKV